MLGEKISPLYIDDNMVPHSSNTTWALNYYLLSIDFPYNSGYSYASQPVDEQNTTAGAVNYLYSFLQILGKKYPSWFQRDIYWFGEDYAGHFIPAMATKILSSNNNPGAIIIPLKGIGIGDPWIDATYQTQYYNAFTYNLGLTNIQQTSNIANAQLLIANNISSGNYNLAFQSFQSLLTLVEGYTNNVNIFNMRYYAQQDLGDLSGWLNLPATKKLLNVPSAGIWTQCNSAVQQDFGADAMQNFATAMMPNLLSSIKVLIYHSQDDLYTNNIGMSY